MSSRSLREGFVKPSRCLHEAFTQWARRGASAKGSRRLHERFMKTSRALKASRSLREGFAKASRRLQPYPRRLRESFAKAPRAPPFGNDSSDNDKPPNLQTPASMYTWYQSLGLCNFVVHRNNNNLIYTEISQVFLTSSFSMTILLQQQ